MIYLIFHWYRSSFTSGRYAYYTIIFLTILFSYLLPSARGNARMLDLQSEVQPGSKYIDLLGLTFVVQLGSFIVIIFGYYIYPTGNRFIMEYACC